MHLKKMIIKKTDFLACSNLKFVHSKVSVLTILDKDSGDADVSSVQRSANRSAISKKVKRQHLCASGLMTSGLYPS